MFRRLGRKVRRLAAGVLDLPQDVVLDLPRITMIGNAQMYIENHRGVVHFSDRQLILRLSVGALDITGQNLAIRAILPEEVLVEGSIADIHYLPHVQGEG